MDLLLNEQQALFADTAARLCAQFGGPKRARGLRDAGVDHNTEAWREIVRAGWLATAVAESRDGLGLGLFDLALAIESAGRHMLMAPLTEGAAVAAALSGLGDNAASALADLLAGTRLIVPATSSPQWGPGGNDVRFDERASTLSGALPFVPFAPSADAFLVATDAVICVVDSKAPGLRIETKTNIDGSTASRLTFSGVEVVALARGATATATAKKLREFLSLGAAVELVGLAAAAHEITIDYIKLRQQFGKPIGSFQALQHRAANNFIEVELNRSLVYRVLAAFDAGEHHPAMVAAAKARCSRSAFQIVREALQMHGAIGYTDEHDIGLYYKRAIALAARYGGDLAHTSHFSELTRA